MHMNYKFWVWLHKRDFGVVLFLLSKQRDVSIYRKFEGTFTAIPLPTTTRTPCFHYPSLDQREGRPVVGSSMTSSLVYEYD